MADAPKGKEKETMKDRARPPSGEELERFKSALQHIVSIPKAEIDRRAKTWTKKRRQKRR